VLQCFVLMHVSGQFGYLWQYGYKGYNVFVFEKLNLSDVLTFVFTGL
jgi:hypothetical protein